MDDDRLKELGGGYFKELLERIRDIPGFWKGILSSGIWNLRDQCWLQP